MSLLNLPKIGIEKALEIIMDKIIKQGQHKQCKLGKGSTIMTSPKKGKFQKLTIRNDKEMSHKTNN